MNTNIVRSMTAAFAICAVMITATVQPAKADGAATTRTIIAGAAAIAAIATVVNVEHKNQVANTVQGYLPDGSTVYEDGHVVGQNGYSWYPGNQGEQIACNNQRCTVYGTGNNGYGYNNGWNNGNNGYGNGGNDWNWRNNHPGNGHS
jgi:hypothetical protein